MKEGRKVKMPTKDATLANKRIETRNNSSPALPLPLSKVKKVIVEGNILRKFSDRIHLLHLYTADSVIQLHPQSVSLLPGKVVTPEKSPTPTDWMASFSKYLYKLSFSAKRAVSRS